MTGDWNVEHLTDDSLDPIIMEGVSDDCSLFSDEFEMLLTHGMISQTKFAPALPPPTIILCGSTPSFEAFLLHLGEFHIQNQPGSK